MFRSPILKSLANRTFFAKTMASQAQFTKNLPSRTPSSEESKIINDILAVPLFPPPPPFRCERIDVCARGYSYINVDLVNKRTVITRR